MNILCACGCGESLESEDSRGRPRRFLSGHNGRVRPRIRIVWKCVHCGTEHESRPSEVRTSCCISVSAGGSLHPSWKGGRIIAQGYVYVWMPEHPKANRRGYLAEHILVAEAKLGRPLTKEEQPHHLNHDRADNRPENIQVLSKHEHMSIHQREAFMVRFGREPFATDEERRAHTAAYARKRRRAKGIKPRYPSTDGDIRDGWVYRVKGNTES